MLLERIQIEFHADNLRAACICTPNTKPLSHNVDIILLCYVIEMSACNTNQVRKMANNVPKNALLHRIVLQ